MIKAIIKRDGSSQKFVPFKIEDAIKKAFNSEVEPYDKSVFRAVMHHINSQDKISVEEVQDIIEKERGSGTFSEQNLNTSSL